MVTGPDAPGRAGVSAVRSVLVLGCAAGFLLYVTAIERLAERGKLSRDQVVLAVALLAGCGLLLLLLEASLQRGHPRHRLEVRWASGCFAVALGSALFLLGSAWTFVTVQRESGPWVVDLGGFRAPVLAALVATGTVAFGALAALAALDRRIRDPEKVPPVIRARILALRGEGKTLKEIAAALDAAKLTAPGGVWTGRILRSLIRSAPRRPPGEKKERDEEIDSRQ